MTLSLKVCDAISTLCSTIAEKPIKEKKTTKKRKIASPSIDNEENAEENDNENDDAAAKEKANKEAAKAKADEIAIRRAKLLTELEAMAKKLKNLQKKRK
ncbi:hypothetical protein Tco_1096114 [Tanacetum coccineum]